MIYCPLKLIALQISRKTDVLKLQRGKANRKESLPFLLHSVCSCFNARCHPEAPDLGQVFFWTWSLVLETTSGTSVVRRESPCDTLTSLVMSHELLMCQQCLFIFEDQKYTWSALQVIMVLNRVSSEKAMSLMLQGDCSIKLHNCGFISWRCLRSHLDYIWQKWWSKLRGFKLN